MLFGPRGQRSLLMWHTKLYKTSWADYWPSSKIFEAWCLRQSGWIWLSALSFNRMAFVERTKLIYFWKAIITDKWKSLVITITQAVVIEFTEQYKTLSSLVLLNNSVFVKLKFQHWSDGEIVGIKMCLAVESGNHFFVVEGASVKRVTRSLGTTGGLTAHK